MMMSNNRFDFESKQKSSVYFKKEKSLVNLNSLPFLLSSIGLPILFIYYVIYYQTVAFMISSTTTTTRISNGRTEITQSRDECDLSEGHWEWDSESPLYTNYSCPTLPLKKNCFLYGRRDKDFLHWRWKPERCELPRFDPRSFLGIVRGKTMGFVGDSLARDQMESLLCLLAQEEKPMPMQEYKDEENSERSGMTWHFSDHNFTVTAFWSQFLVVASEIIINGSSSGGFDLHLEKVDSRWSTRLPYVDYVIFSASHWFFRPNYLYQRGKLIGCTYCQSPNVTHLEPNYAIRMAFRTVLEHVNGCKNCSSGLLTVVRTYSPAHFENGAWDKGGYCNRTRPFSGNSEEEMIMKKMSQGGALDLDHRNVQVEEVEKAKKITHNNNNSNKKFEVVDITKAMRMRGDGHPGVHWRNEWMDLNGYRDCVHWCLPGPIDTWNEILLRLLTKHSSGM